MSLVTASQMCGLRLVTVRWHCGVGLTIAIVNETRLQLVVSALTFVLSSVAADIATTMLVIEIARRHPPAH